MAAAAGRSGASGSKMYACDREGMTVLGGPLFEPAPTSAELRRVRQILMDSRLFLIASPTEAKPMPEEMKFVMDMWLHRWDECCMELRGASVTDDLFVARCYMLCMEEPRTREMATLNDISELYARLQLLGTNHTRRRFDQLESASEVAQLEKRCACLVVYDLSDSCEEVLARLGDRLPAVGDLLQAVIEPLRHVPDTCAKVEPGQLTVAEKEREAKLAAQSEVTIEDETALPLEVEFDVNEGSFWHSDKQTVVRSFVAMASRVLRNYWLQKTIFDRYPVRPKERCPKYSDYAKNSLRAWLQKVCKNEYSDSSVKIYRNLIYEHWMPAGSRQECLRVFSTKYDFMQSLNLLENQLGVDSATSLANIARSKTQVVSMDPKHEVYDFLLLSQFCYMMLHKTTVPFLADYYIMPGQLCKLRKRLDCKVTWGQPRLPLMTYLTHVAGLVIHDAGEWILCTDMEDCLLNVMTLWVQNYGGKVASGVSMVEWVSMLTTEEEEDDWEVI
jgi:hypothetical protein